MTNLILSPIDYQEYYSVWEDSAAQFLQLIAILKDNVWKVRINDVIQYISDGKQPRTNVLINPLNATTNIWGPIYWKFLHLTSILLQFKLNLIAPGKKSVPIEQLKHHINFIVCIITLDKGLICGVCAHNYTKLKSEEPTAIEFLKKEYCSGFFIYATYLFHNMISTHNNKQRIGALDFAKIYKIYPIRDTRAIISNIYDLPVYQFNDKSLLDKISKYSTENKIEVEYIVSKIYKINNIQIPDILIPNKEVATFINMNNDDFYQKITSI